MTSWFTADDCRLPDFRAFVEQKTELTDYPHAADVVDNVLIYRDSLPGEGSSPGWRRVCTNRIATPTRIPRIAAHTLVRNPR